MLVSEHGILFIHIPKTGGTSVERAIMRSFPDLFDLSSEAMYYNNLCPAEYRRYCLDGRSHKPISYFRKFPEYQACFKFAFVRNPYDTLLSHYKYVQYLPARGRHYRDFGHLIEWLESGRDEMIYRSENPYHLFPQSDFIGDGSELDFVGRCENLRDDFGIVAKKLGLRVRTLERMNQTPSKPGREIMTPYLDFINAYYARDFELFGYEKQDYF